MTRQEIIQAAVSVVEEMRMPWVPNPNTRYRKKPPKSKGNMATNGLGYREENDAFIVYIDLAKAPYFPFTEYPWTSPRKGGKKNPNEGWVERFQEEFARRFADKLGGKIER